MFKVIIAGGRDFDDLFTLVSKCNEILKAKEKDGIEIVSGGQRTKREDGNNANGGYYGADYFGELYALGRGYQLKKFPADWDKHGKAAGPIRNKEMASYADALIAFWDGKSRGTANMIEEMKRLNKPVRVIKYGEVRCSGVKREGESCTKNNNCTYPNCT